MHRGRCVGLHHEARGHRATRVASACMAFPVKNRHAPAERDSVEELELELLLEGVYRHYGYDFRDYARTSIRRRVTKLMREEGVDTISALQARVLHDAGAWDRFLQGISVNVSA